jgi:hypothetical protein
MLRANRVFAFLAFIYVLSITVVVNGQGKQAIVVLRSEQSSATGCDGNVDLTYQILYDVKINNKDEIRLLSPVGPSLPSSVSRDDYEKSGKRKLRDLYALKWDSVLSAVSVSGQGGFLALPDDMKPQKGLSPNLSSFYNVTLTGEERTGKVKRKLDVPLRTIAQVYFVAEGAPVNDSLFNHAAEEARVSVWEAYLKKTNNYRSSEANTKMHEALVQCARADLRKFVDGDYAFLAKVRERVGRAQSIKDDETVRQLAAEVNRAQQEVENARGITEQLIKAEKWDEAIKAAAPIKKYLDSWPELKQMYDHANEQSHEVHLNAADKAWVAGQLETSLSECSVAWDRLKNSERARTCVCRARNEIAVRDSQQNRKINRPKDAKELLEKQIADSDCKADPRLAVELKSAKCEYAQQLYARSRQLLGVGGNAAPPRPNRRRPVAATTPGAPTVKAISMANKKDFRDAREQLILASELCPEDEIRNLLLATNRRLADFCKDEARKALARNDDGTAYVYLVSAQAYMPEDTEVNGLLADARERFQQRTRVSVGVVLQNESRGPEGSAVIVEVTDAIHSAATSSGLAQPNILDARQAAAAWQAIQTGRAMNTPTIIFAGGVMNASVDVSENPHNVQSSYSYQNPRWKEADRQHDAVNEEYKKCRKQYGDAQCGNLASRVAQLRSYRDQIQQTITEQYYYRENPKRMTGVARMSLRSSDSISRGARSGDTLQANDEWQCVERTGVNEKDYGKRDNFCPTPDPREFFGRIAGKIKSDAFMHATTQLREMPLSYYRRAQSAANRQQSVEDYLRFIFLTRDKSATEAQQAKAYVIAFDPELTTDGVIR